MLNKFSEYKHQQPLKKTEAERLKSQAWNNFRLLRSELDEYHPALVAEMGRLMSEYAEARLEGIEDVSVS